MAYQIASHHNENDIAVIGQSCRLPGANNPAQYWQNLRDGIESIRHYSDEELIEAGVTPELLSQPNYVKSGAPLESMEKFDAEFFGFSPKEAAIMDPQHRQLLECSWEALESAGQLPEKFDGSIGVFAGCGMNGYMMYNLLTNPDLMDSVGLFLIRHTGNDKDFLATRISYCLNLTGPSVNVQTACSTSLVAIHSACQSLLNQECDMALAGGVTIELPHRQGYLYQEGEILSPDGHCRAFDQKAKGTLFGSGAGMVLLRPLHDAIDAGDPIIAVIKGTAINNDGCSKVGYLAPSVDGQAAAIAEALEVSGLDANAISYVETHGTGTPVGDPIEIAALTQAFSQTTEHKNFCGLGSVKTNIGHLDTAAGVASFIKVCLALNHEQLPPSLNFDQANPGIDFPNSPFYVNHTLTPWLSEQPRRAGVSSLGVGGTNAHVIVEQAPLRLESPVSTRDYQLLTLSGRNKNAVLDNGHKLAEFLRDPNSQENFADVAFTLQTGRRHFDHRAVVICRDSDEALATLEQPQADSWVQGQVAQPLGPISFLYPGGGTQYPRMGFDLYQTEPVYQQHIDRGLSILKDKYHTDLSPYLFADPAVVADAAIEFLRPSLQLPAIFITEYALTQLWLHWDVTPESLIGHSMGENTAACIAGVMSFEDCLGLVKLRGQLFERIPKGGMLSIGIPAQALTPLLPEALDLAASNGPELCVVSGPDQALDDFAQQMAAKNVESTRIPIDIAAHSKMLEPILAEFSDYLHSINLHPPTIPFISNRTGDWISDEQATDPDYWVEHLRHSVRFSDGIDTLLATPGRILIEVGPGKTLGSLARQSQYHKPRQVVLSSLRHQDESIADDRYFFKTIAQLHIAGVALNWQLLHNNEPRQRISLPTYAFQHQHYWIEPGAARDQLAKDRLQRLANIDDWFYQPNWQAYAIPADQNQLEPLNWLVFMDELGIAERFCTELKRRGQHVVTVRKGHSFSQLSPTEYLVDSDRGRDGYDSLVQALLANDTKPQRIAHFWLYSDEPAQTQWHPAFFHRYQERGFYSILFLTQALADENAIDNIAFDIVSTGMQQVHNEPLAHPEKALVLGPSKVLPHEFPTLNIRSIDVAAPQASPAINKLLHRKQVKNSDSLLWQTLLAAPENATVAIRDQKHWRQTCERIELQSNDIQSLIRERGVYLITGGLGGIGLTVASLLAEQQARLVLTSRTLIPAQEQWQDWLERHDEQNRVSQIICQVQTLQSQGAEVLIVAADVGNIDEMQYAVAATIDRFGALNGVIHAAGALNEGPSQTKTQLDIEEVLQPKVQGLGVLEQATKGINLDFTVLCSSTSTVLGPPGQTDYVAANAFLNAYARNRIDSQLGQVIALNWGVWNEVGMAASLTCQNNPIAKAVPGPQPKHVLFDSQEFIGDDEVHFIGRYSPDHHWFFAEHRTKDGQALLPGTGYIQLIQAALAESEQHQSFAIHDLEFLHPLQIDDNQQRNVRVVWHSKNQTVTIQSQHQQDASRWHTHAQARVVLSPRAHTDSLIIDTVLERCQLNTNTDCNGLRGKQENFLQFGPRWRVLQEVNYGTDEALAKLALPSSYHHDLQDYSLHPALLDIATGYAMELISGYSGAELWVPMTYEQLHIYAPLTSQIFSWVRNHKQNSADSEIAVFDITITDNTGRVLIEIDKFTIRRLQADQFEKLNQSTPQAIDDMSTLENKRLPQSSPQQAFQQMLALGIRPTEGAEAFAKALTHPRSQLLVSSIDLNDLISRANAVEEQSATTEATFARPELSNDFVEPENELQKNLISMWQKLLGVDRIGIADSFFDLGGHSLIAVRLFNNIRKQYGIDLGLSTLFEAPTVEQLASLLEQSGAFEQTGNSASRKRATPAKSWSTVVPIQPNGDKPPLFCAAGMGGNPMNLRHLATHLGFDQPFYGLQHRGVDGQQKPHNTVEEMAAEYLADIRKIQPEGPYYLGGFSGGGVAAFEMAQQLQLLGEEVALLYFLDSYCPTLPTRTLPQRIMIHLDRLRRRGLHSLPYIWHTIKGRASGDIIRVKQMLVRPFSKLFPNELRFEQICVAWVDAESRYQPKDYTATNTALFRIYRDPDAAPTNRVVDLALGWGSYIPDLQVHEVPGTHTTMCTEPYVATLAKKLDVVLADTRRKNPTVTLPPKTEP